MRARGRGGAWAVGPERVNPFSRPEVLEPVEPQASGGQAEPLELRGVIAAADQPVANLNGVVLTLGEEAFGYVLESVGTGTAVFVKGDERVVLHVAEPAEDEP